MQGELVGCRACFGSGPCDGALSPLPTSLVSSGSLPAGEHSFPFQFLLPGESPARPGGGSWRGWVGGGGQWDLSPCSLSSHGSHVLRGPFWEDCTPGTGHHRHTTFFQGSPVQPRLLHLEPPEPEQHPRHRGEAGAVASWVAPTLVRCPVPSTGEVACGSSSLSSELTPGILSAHTRQTPSLPSSQATQCGLHHQEVLLQAGEDGQRGPHGQHRPPRLRGRAGAEAAGRH